MTSQKVYELRKEAKLEDALELALANIVNEPGNVWNKRALAWVYYEFLKKAQQENNFGDFTDNLNKIQSIDLPPADVMLFDSCAWSIGKLLFNNKKIRPEYFQSIFDAIHSFGFSKPSDSYSILLKSFNTHANNWSHFVEFVNWWGLHNFEKKDYQKFELENGNKIPSLVESVFISISKHLLRRNDSVQIEQFIPVISSLCIKHKEMQYPPYYLAKLLLALGKKDDFIATFLPFARKKQREFWVWDLLSEIFEKNSKEYFSCLCKSLSCGAPDKFTINVREKLAEVFIKNKQFDKAKLELSTIIDCRKKEGWNLLEKHTFWPNYNWWKQTHSLKNNLNIYTNNLKVAESLLFSDTEEELLVVGTVNEEKLVFDFIVSKQKYGFIHYGKFKIKPKSGEVYAVRFYEKEKSQKSSFYQVQSLVKSEELVSPEIYKKLIGTIQIKPGNSFGFVDGCFVSPHIINKHKLAHGERVKTIAIQKLITKKNEWGWNVILIEN